MKPDPTPRRDNTCVVCRKPKGVPKGSWGRADAVLDPFCSSACCRKWHGTELPVDGAAKPEPGRCKGCRCPDDERTPGCRVCKKRYESRRRAAKERGASV